MFENVRDMVVAIVALAAISFGFWQCTECSRSDDHKKEVIHKARYETIQGCVDSGRSAVECAQID